MQPSSAASPQPDDLLLSSPCSLPGSGASNPGREEISEVCLRVWGRKPRQTEPAVWPSSNVVDCCLQDACSTSTWFCWLSEPQTQFRPRKWEQHTKGLVQEAALGREHIALKLSLKGLCWAPCLSLCPHDIGGSQSSFSKCISYFKRRKMKNKICFEPFSLIILFSWQTKLVFWAKIQHKFWNCHLSLFRKQGVGFSPMLWIAVPFQEIDTAKLQGRMDSSSSGVPKEGSCPGRTGSS